MTPGEFRIRFRFPKAGRLRWLSHLEVVRTLERCVRRARLPYAVTQGFSPHMKVAFGPALPVGTGSENEYFDVWLTMYTRPDEALAKMVASSPADIAATEAVYVSEKEPSLAAALVIATYRIDVKGEKFTPQSAHEALMSVLSAGELTIEQKGKTKVFDLARSLPKEPRVTAADDGVSIELTVRMGSHGSLRPESLIRAAFEKADLEISSVRTTRLDLFAEESEGVWSRPV